MALICTGTYIFSGVFVLVMGKVIRRFWKYKTQVFPTNLRIACTPFALRVWFIKNRRRNKMFLKISTRMFCFRDHRVWSCLELQSVPAILGYFLTTIYYYRVLPEPANESIMGIRKPRTIDENILMSGLPVTPGTLKWLKWFCIWLWFVTIQRWQNSWKSLGFSNQKAWSILESGNNVIWTSGN